MTYALKNPKAIVNSILLLMLLVGVFFAETLIIPTDAYSSSPQSHYRNRIEATGLAVTGKGTVIGIFDGGMNVDSKDFSTGGTSRIVSQDCVGSSDEVNPCDSRDDHRAHNMCSTSDIGCFHGMAVAGFAAANDKHTILNGKDEDVGGVASEASISYIRVAMTKSGVIQYDDFVEALEKFAEDVRNNSFTAPDVINLSLSFPRSGYQECNEDNEAKRLIDELVASGVVIVAATGNDSNKSEVTYPACMDNVIAVGSTGFDGVERVSGFSNMSSDVDIVAPGQQQWGMLPQESRYLSVSGTSFAAPLVSGAVALLKQANPQLTPQQVKNVLVSTGDPVIDPITNETYSELNVSRAVNQVLSHQVLLTKEVVSDSTSVNMDNIVIAHAQPDSITPTIKSKREETITSYPQENTNTAIIIKRFNVIVSSIGAMILMIIICVRYRRKRMKSQFDRNIDILSSLYSFERWEKEMDSLHAGQPLYSRQKG